MNAEPAPGCKEVGDMFEALEAMLGSEWETNEEGSDFGDSSGSASGEIVEEEGDLEVEEVSGEGEGEEEEEGSEEEEEEEEGSGEGEEEEEGSGEGGEEGSDQESYDSFVSDIDSVDFDAEELELAQVEYGAYGYAQIDAEADID